jgi:hypothetical protein
MLSSSNAATDTNRQLQILLYETLHIHESKNKGNLPLSAAHRPFFFGPID